MKSMTGYALSETQVNEGFISLEIKSYNSRYLDIFINMPFWLSGLESFFKNLISSKIKRGKIEVYIKIKKLEIDIDITSNSDIALSYINIMQEISKKANIPMTIDLTKLIEKDGVLSVEKDVNIDYWKKILQPIFNKTINTYNKSRSLEGDTLKNDILSNLEKITSAVKKIKNKAPQMEKKFYTNIKEKTKELLNSEIDENRLMQEIAIMLVKYTINEEIVRLESHCNTLKDQIETDEPIGKKIDFLCQEINREINTIGSKNQMLEMTDYIITVKDSLENIREQARNIE